MRRSTLLLYHHPEDQYYAFYKVKLTIAWDTDENLSFQGI